jgi:nucleobase transporter 1/2
LSIRKNKGDNYVGWIFGFLCKSNYDCWVTVDIIFVSIAARLVFYGIQHYLSIAGSLVFVPLILVPTMGGSDV